MSRRHELKCWPEPFAAVRSGAKPFELRWNDRDYAVGDVLVLQEFDPVRSSFTGEVEERRVSYVSGEAETRFFGLAHGYVLLGVQTPRPAPREAAPADHIELLDWHAEMAASARVRADGWRRSAGLHRTSADRYLGAAGMAETEAGQHEAAVALIRDLVAVVRRLAAPEPRRG